MEVEYTDLQKGLIDALQNAEGKPFHCMRNSINHIEKAYKISEIDAEMAIFRAITSEEEAASGLIHLLKKKGYKNSSKIKPNVHNTKQGLIPFVQVVSRFLKETTQVIGQPQLFTSQDEEGKTFFDYVLQFPNGRYGSLMPPLNFSVIDKDTGKHLNFEQKISEYLDETEQSTLREYINKISNTRNRVLYADEDGYPVVTEGVGTELEKRKRNAFIMIGIFCLEYPYGEKKPICSAMP